MKKILLAVEYVGREGFEESDKKILDYVRTHNDFNEIHVLCREFILNETGEYIRAKGIYVHTTENGSVVNAPKDYDEIVAVDQWANANIAMFNTKNVETMPQETLEQKALKGDGKSVLIATNHLNSLGETETWTYTMAKEFERLGYLVDVFTFNKGKVSEKLNTVDYPKPIYDLIIINHNTCLEYLKDIKGKKIFTSHGVFPDLEQPIEGADKYVAISEEVQKHMKEKGFKAEIIRNGIDCDRFKPKKKIRKKPKSVLCMCQGEEARENVKKACDELGLEFQETPTRIWEVEDKINEADIVFTIGRGAYEAMACGRAVIVYDSRPFNTADGIVTRNNAKKLAQANFSGRTNKLRWTVEDIKKEIKKYKDTMGTDNRKIAVTSFNIKKQAKKYIDLLKSQESQEFATRKRL